MNKLTLPMFMLLLSKAQGLKDFSKPSQPSHVGIHWIALAEYVLSDEYPFARI